MTEKTVEVTVSPEKGEATVAEPKKPALPIEDQVMNHCRSLLQFAVGIPVSPKNREFRRHAVALYALAEETIIARDAELARARQVQAAFKKRAAAKEATAGALEAPAN